MQRVYAKAQARQETYYNQHRREAEFQVGQEVLLSTAHVRIASPGTPKLLPKYIGSIQGASKARYIGI